MAASDSTDLAPGLPRHDRVATLGLQRPAKRNRLTRGVLRIAASGAEFLMPACALGLHDYPSGRQRYVRVPGLDGARQAFPTGPARYPSKLAARGTFVSLRAAAVVGADRGMSHRADGASSHASPRKGMPRPPLTLNMLAHRSIGQLPECGSLQCRRRHSWCPKEPDIGVAAAA